MKNQGVRSTSSPAVVNLKLHQEYCLSIPLALNTGDGHTGFFPMARKLDNGIQRMRTTLLIVSVATVSCAVSDIDYLGKKCSGECPGSLTCVDGFCQVGRGQPDGGSDSGGTVMDMMPGLNTPDSGMPSDNGPDAAVPGGDGGSTLPPGTDSGTPTADAGKPVPDSGMMVPDAGKPVDPCALCSATQRCIASKCVNESDIVGSTCAADKACPTGFDCTASICVKRGARYCNSVRETVTYCADFDGALPVEGFWKSNPVTSPVRLEVADDSTRVPTKLLLASIPKPSGNYLQAVLWHEVAKASWTKIVFSFDMRTELQEIPKTDAALSVAQILCTDTSGGPKYRGVYLDYSGGQFSNLAVLGMASPDSRPSFYQQLDIQPLDKQWTRVRIEATRAAGDLTGAIYIDGKLGKMHTGGGCGGLWQVQLGIGSDKAGGMTQYDNILYTEE